MVSIQYPRKQGRKGLWITFIDSRKAAVINASALGKAYSGHTLVKRFNRPEGLLVKGKGRNGWDNGWRTPSEGAMNVRKLVVCKVFAAVSGFGEGGEAICRACNSYVQNEKEEERRNLL